MCGNYSREETIQGRKLYEEIRYPMEATGAAYGGEAHSAQRGVLPVYFPVDLFLLYIVVNPPERKLAKRTSVAVEEGRGWRLPAASSLNVYTVSPAIHSSTL